MRGNAPKLAVIGRSPMPGEGRPGNEPKTTAKVHAMKFISGSEMPFAAASDPVFAQPR
jgi:hypothetical protein